MNILRQKRKKASRMRRYESVARKRARRIKKLQARAERWRQFKIKKGFV